VRRFFVNTELDGVCTRYRAVSIKVDAKYCAHALATCREVRQPRALPGVLPYYSQSEVWSDETSEMPIGSAKYKSYVYV
jgi:hypothetical protein